MHANYVLKPKYSQNDSIKTFFKAILTKASYCNLTNLIYSKLNTLIHISNLIPNVLFF